MSREFRFNRVLLKISGEALKGTQDHGYDAEAVREVVSRVKRIIDQDVEVALVVGAGNIWRGVMGRSGGMDRVNADYMGMLATVMNALCLRDFFTAAGVPAIVQSSIGMEPIQWDVEALAAVGTARGASDMRAPYSSSCSGRCRSAGHSKKLIM